MDRPGQSRALVFFKYLSWLIHSRISEIIFVPSGVLAKTYYNSKTNVKVWYSGGIRPEFFTGWNNHVKKEVKYDFVFVGRDEKVKGIDYICTLAPKLIEDGYRLCVIMPQLPKQLEELIGYENFSWFRKLSAMEVRDVLEECDTILVPSLNESLCLALAEAILLGCKAIVNDLPVFRELYCNVPVVTFASDYFEFSQIVKHHESRIYKELSETKPFDFLRSTEVMRMMNEIYISKIKDFNKL